MSYLSRVELIGLIGPAPLNKKVPGQDVTLDAWLIQVRLAMHVH